MVLKVVFAILLLLFSSHLPFVVDELGILEERNLSKGVDGPAIKARVLHESLDDLCV